MPYKISFIITTVFSCLLGLFILFMITRQLYIPPKPAGLSLRIANIINIHAILIFFVMACAITFSAFVSMVLAFVTRQSLGHKILNSATWLIYVLAYASIPLHALMGYFMSAALLASCVLPFLYLNVLFSQRRIKQANPMPF